MKPAPPTPRNLLAALVAGLAAFALARTFPSPPASMAPKIADAKSAPTTLAAETSELPNTAVPATGASVTSSETLFAQALEEKDVFRAAAKSFAAIEQLTAKDFAGFLEKRDAPMVFTSMYTAYGKALARAFVARWLAVDPEGGLASMLAMNTPGRDGEPYRFGDELWMALAELRPAQFLAAVPKGGAQSFEDDSPSGRALTALARTQPDAARRFVEAVPDVERTELLSLVGGVAEMTEVAERKEARVRFLVGLAESDPVGAVREARTADAVDDVARLALRTAERTGLGTVRQVLTELGDDWPDYDEIPVLCARYPSLAADLKFPEDFRPSGSEEKLADVFGRLPMDELRRRLEASDQLPEAIREVLAGSMTSAWAAREPREAIAWAMAQPKKDDDAPAGLVSDAYTTWQQANPPAAFAWWNALPESALKRDLGGHGALEAAERGDIEVAMRMNSGKPINLGSAKRETAFIAHAAAAQEPATTARWLAGLPHIKDLAEQMPAAVKGWYARDPGEVAEWVESLPAGTWRDEAAANLAAATQLEDSTATAEWLAVIGDAERRAREVGKVFDRYRHADPAQARAWLHEVPELTPEERLKILRPWRAKKTEDAK